MHAGAARMLLPMPLSGELTNRVLLLPPSCGGLFSRKLHGCDIVIYRLNTFIDRIQARVMGTLGKRGEVSLGGCS